MVSREVVKGDMGLFRLARGHALPGNLFLGRDFPAFALMADLGFQ